MELVGTELSSFILWAVFSALDSLRYNTISYYINNHNILHNNDCYTEFLGTNDKEKAIYVQHRLKLIINACVLRLDGPLDIEHVNMENQLYAFMLFWLRLNSYLITQDQWFELLLLWALACYMILWPPTHSWAHRGLLPVTCLYYIFIFSSCAFLRSLL